MKIIQEPKESLPTRIISGQKAKFEILEKYSLKFKDSSTENSYIRSLILRKNNNEVLSNKQNHKYFAVYLVVTIVIYDIFYIAADNSASIITFQIVFLNSVGMVLFLVYFLIQKRYLASFLSEILMIFYLLLGTSLIINNQPVQLLIFGQSATNFSCVFGLLVLQNSSKFVVLMTFRAYAFTNLLISGLYLVLHLVSSQFILITILEFLVVFCYSIMESMKFYFIEIAKREKFVLYKNCVVNIKNEETMTEIEEISSGLHESLEILNFLIPLITRNKVYLQRMHEVLSKIFKTILTKNNIYEVDVE